MQIIFRNKKHKEKHLLIPNGLLLNRLVAEVAANMLTQRGIHLSGRQIKKLMQDLNRVRERQPDWVLLEAEDANGEKFKIIF